MTENHQELLKFNAEISKVLKLMIHSLYTNKGIFLRELVSNSSDACDKLRHLAITAPELVADNPEFFIDVRVDKAARTITVADNGIGMSREELIANLGTIAKSGTQEFLSQLSGDSQKDSPLIGQFGVGFYASFMVADRVRVVSRRAGSDTAYAWESAGEGEFSIAPAEKNTRGTEITLFVKETEDDYLDSYRLRHILTTYSDHIAFPIWLEDADQQRQQVNSAGALWMRQKSDITPEQYREFYHHVAHSPEEPWLTMHNKVEGKLEYTSLLFIPAIKPFDLFHPDRKRRLKLYVRRVFITEDNVELVPGYLRFLRGIVDSQDLPLNISRETLQHSTVLGKIRDSLVSRVLSELRKKVDSDLNAYMTFWNLFGSVLKEGLCEATSPREQILEVSRFYSSDQTAGETTSLDDYIARMKPGQEDIYYLTGENLASLRSSPQIEGFTARGIEVLLLCDHVDDFWVNVISSYKNKPLKSVTRADIKLEPFPLVNPPKETDSPPAAPADTEALCARIKAILGEAVKDVRPSDKLASSAVCLAVEEGAMDIRLERFLLEQRQLQAAAPKILEINPSHPIIRGMAARESIDDVVWLLLDQARIMEGETISDPAAFTRRLQSFVEKSMAA